MASQFGEHEFILKHFAGRTGRFLDVGAFDGVTFSNTKPLADLGWSGVCVEPSPPAFCWLMKTYADNPRVTLVNAALAGQSGIFSFQCNTSDAYSADMMSTFSEEHAEKFKGHPFREIAVPAIDWDDFLKFCVDMGPAYDNVIGYLAHRDSLFDFVNIDVEGLNYEVLSNMPIRPEMLCVEIDPADDGEVLRWMARHQYETTVIGGNALGVRR